MSTRTRSTTIACTKCGQTAPRPADVQWRPLWDAGWRWIGTLDLFSCPGCPPVIVVDEEGRHQTGPGVSGTERPR